MSARRDDNARVAWLALEDVFIHGNRTRYKPGVSYRHKSNWFRCVDGASFSVIAGWGTYCVPRPGILHGDGAVDADYAGPFVAVEAWFHDESDPRTATWAEVYAYVHTHGGLAEVAPPGRRPQEWGCVDAPDEEDELDGAVGLPGGETA